MKTIPKLGGPLMACLILILTLSCRFASAQKQDYVWLSGFGSSTGYDTVNHWLFGTSILNFNWLPVDTAYDTLAMNFDATNVSYCDSNGNLLFYSNGIYIANSLDKAIENGDSLNAGWFQYVWDPNIQTLGYRTPQGILAFQSSANANYYYLFHSYVDSLPGSDGTNVIVSKTLLTELDMSANAGLGIAIFKNQSIVNDTLGGELTAVRHGNGRDWWLLVQKRNSNCYYRILIDTAGPHLMPDLTCAGDAIEYGDVGSQTFSPDGSIFIHYAIIGGLNIFDFDRCTGLLSNPVYIPLNIWSDSSWLGNGVAVSPSNRFLYVSATKVMLQYDLWATDIASSVDTVGIYDGFQDPFGSLFNTAQIAPDGRIYVSCGNGERDYHVIERPDSLGDSCLFIQHGMLLPTSSGGVPNFPNYRLGSWQGGACDTLTALTEVAREAKEQIIKVFPNPSSDYVVVDYGFTDWNKGQVNLEICNVLGQPIYEQLLPMYSGFQKIDVSKFASGIYMAYIKRNDGVVAREQFVKQ